LYDTLNRERPIRHLYDDSVGADTPPMLEIIARAPALLAAVAANVAVVVVGIKLVGVWPTVAIYSLALTLAGVAVIRGLRLRSQRTSARPRRNP
jgi:hypothetical protein